MKKKKAKCKIIFSCDHIYNMSWRDRFETEGPFLYKVHSNFWKICIKSRNLIFFHQKRTFSDPFKLPARIQSVNKQHWKWSPDETSVSLLLDLEEVVNERRAQNSSKAHQEEHA